MEINIDKNHVYDKESLKKELCKNLESVLSIIDTHNTKSFNIIGILKGEKIFIKAEYGNETKTNLEIDWYLKFNEKDISPKMLYSLKTDDFSLFILEFLEKYDNLENLIIKKPLDKIYLYINELLKIVQNVNFLGKEDIPITKLKEDLILKTKIRLSELKKYNSDFFSYEFIYINGQKYNNPLFKDSYMKLFHNPIFFNKDYQKIGYVHGDLHFGNILINENDIIKLVDTKLIKNPVSYDIGKLLHSSNGKYNLLMSKYLLFEGSKDLFKQHIYNKELYIKYDKITAIIKNSIDKDIYLQSKLFEFLHFVNILSHHTNGFELNSLFCISVILFNELNLK